MSDVTDNVLMLTVGLPRSGKSTWARTQGVPVVNPDSIRLALHGSAFIGLAEPFVWAIAKVMVRALFLCGHDRVILDATNTTRKRRDEWKSQTWRRKFHEVPTEVGECLQRVRLAGDDEVDGLREAIIRMDENFEPVEPGERED